MCVLSHNSSVSGAVSAEYLDSFPAEQRRSLAAVFADLAKQFPQSEQSLLSVSEARLVVVMGHLGRLGAAYRGGVTYIERMLWNQVWRSDDFGLAFSLSLNPNFRFLDDYLSLCLSLLFSISSPSRIESPVSLLLIFAAVNSFCAEQFL